MTTKKIIFYIAIVIILVILLTVGFRAPKTTENNSRESKVTENNDLNLKAETDEGFNIFDGIINDDQEKKSNKNVEPVIEVPSDTNAALSGFPLYEKAELTTDAYRAYKRNGLIDINDWNESVINGAPALQVIGQGARGYFKIELNDAKEFLEFYANPDININGWRYEDNFKNDVIAHKPNFKNSGLYDGDERLEKGEHISYALSKDGYFGTVTIFHPRFDDDFLVMFADVMEE